MSDETRTLIREHWERCLTLWRRIEERFAWLDAHPHEADWSELFGKVLATSERLATEMDVIYDALGGVGGAELMERLQLCAKGKV